MTIAFCQAIPSCCLGCDFRVGGLIFLLNSLANLEKALLSICCPCEPPGKALEKDRAGRLADKQPRLGWKGLELQMSVGSCTLHTSAILFTKFVLLGLKTQFCNT